MEAGPDHIIINGLRVTQGPMDGGSGHCGIPVIFTNVGEVTTTLFGYPKVTALDASGEPVAEARPEPSGYLGGLQSDGLQADGSDSGSESGGSENDAVLPTIALLPGESASAMVEAVAYEIPDGKACRPYVSISVTPPGESQAAVLQWECHGGTELQVHPVVPGQTGQQR